MCFKHSWNTWDYNKWKSTISENIEQQCSKLGIVLVNLHKSVLKDAGTYRLIHIYTFNDENKKNTRNDFTYKQKVGDEHLKEFL